MRRDPRASLDVVLPAFNEAGNLPALFAQLRATLPPLTPHWRLLLIDDGSTDDTGAVALAARDAGLPLRYVRLSRNFGKEAALTAGLALADADRVLLMDADGQHAPELIVPMHQAWLRGADMACAVRADRREEGPLKRWGTRLFYRLVNAATRLPIPPDAGDFRLLDRRVVRALNALPERNRFMKGLYAWVGYRTEFLPYTPRPRASGRSHFSLGRLLHLAFNGVTAFTNLPLRISSLLGAGVACGALAYGSFLIVEHLLYGHPIPGWPTVVVGLMFFSGVQLLSIGLLGEYVGRIFDEVKQRPLYLVAQDTGPAA